MSASSSGFIRGEALGDDPAILLFGERVVNRLPRSIEEEEQGLEPPGGGAVRELWVTQQAVQQACHPEQPSESSPVPVPFLCRGFPEEDALFFPTEKRSTSGAPLLEQFSGGE